jgi:hypothetical protein
MFDALGDQGALGGGGSEEEGVDKGDGLGAHAHDIAQNSSDARCGPSVRFDG